MRRCRFLYGLIGIGLMLAGCAPKTVISIKRPGELNVKGVSKIVLLDFNTIQSHPSAGRFAADQATLDLAKKSLADVFYEAPFYALVDMKLEKKLDPNGLAPRRQRYDAIVHGYLWWELSDEYRNYVPVTYKLKEWKRVSYPCGRDSKGRVKYCQKDLATRQKEKLCKSYYRAKAATLMLALNVYRLNAGGQEGAIEKVTEIFEVAKEHVLVRNGRFYLAHPCLLGEEESGDRADTLKKKKDFRDSFSGWLEGFKKWQGEKKRDEAGDLQVVHQLSTIPSSLEFKIALMKAVQEKLQKRIAPHYEEFEVTIPLNSDPKSTSLLKCSAFQALIEYIVQNKLASGYDALSQYFYDVDFVTGAKKVIQKGRKKKYREENQGKSSDKIEPYKALTAEELSEQENDYLENRVDDMYNLGLAYEAIGEYDRALAIYRFAFENYESTDQDFADGIGRCLFALDMADRLTEEMRTQRKARKESNL